MDSSPGRRSSTKTDVYPGVFGDKKIPVLEHPPYSPDLAPSDFFLFPEIKSGLKRTGFESVDAVKKKATQLMYDLSEKDFQHCFQQDNMSIE